MSRTHFRRAALALAALLTISTISAPAPAAAQSLSGVRARLWSATPPLRGAVGTIYSVGADTMSMLLQGQPTPVGVPLASVLRLEVSRGDRADNVARWLRRGMLAGVVTGATYGALRSTGREGTVGDSDGGACSEGGRCDHAIRYGLGGLAAGAILGGIWGGITGREVWEEVRLPSRVR